VLIGDKEHREIRSLILVYFVGFGKSSGLSHPVYKFFENVNQIGGHPVYKLKTRCRGVGLESSL